VHARIPPWPHAAYSILLVNEGFPVNMNNRGGAGDNNSNRAAEGGEKVDERVWSGDTEPGNFPIDTRPWQAIVQFPPIAKIPKWCSRTGRRGKGVEVRNFWALMPVI
jgi:hypothetical protein